MFSFTEPQRHKSEMQNVRPDMLSKLKDQGCLQDLFLLKRLMPITIFDIIQYFYNIMSVIWTFHIALSHIALKTTSPHKFLPKLIPPTFTFHPGAISYSFIAYTIFSNIALTRTGPIAPAENDDDTYQIFIHFWHECRTHMTHAQQLFLQIQ